MCSDNWSAVNIIYLSVYTNHLIAVCNIDFDRIKWLGYTSIHQTGITSFIHVNLPGFCERFLDFHSNFQNLPDSHNLPSGGFRLPGFENATSHTDFLADFDFQICRHLQ